MFSFLHPLPEPSPASGRGSVGAGLSLKNLFMRQRLLKGGRPGPIMCFNGLDMMS
jgi:hypothetical protein